MRNGPICSFIISVIPTRQTAAGTLELGSGNRPTRPTSCAVFRRCRCSSETGRRRPARAGAAQPAGPSTVLHCSRSVRVAPQRSGARVMTTAPPTPLILALDVGTSSTRTILFDRDAQMVEGQEVKRPYRLRTTPDGGVEADADELVAIAADAIDEALRMAGPLAGSIAAVGISCFWHSLMGIDRDGRALTPVYSWADTRSEIGRAHV